VPFYKASSMENFTTLGILHALEFKCGCPGDHWQFRGAAGPMR